MILNYPKDGECINFANKFFEKLYHTPRNFLVHTTETIVDSTIWAIVGPTAKFS